jgi:transposase
MYIETIRNRNSPPAILLRESIRKGKKVLKRTLSNLSHWPAHKIENFRRLLGNKPLAAPEDIFSVQSTSPFGHVDIVLGCMRKLKLDSILASRHCKERDLIVALIVERLLCPASKLATTRLWHLSTLAEDLSIKDANENDLYAALDWLMTRKDSIEQKLASIHLAPGALVLYDTSNSFYYGRTCPLAKYGNNKSKNGLPIISYGVLTDEEGRPVAVDIYPGNTGDPKTVPDQVVKIRVKFKLEHVVLAGDRGMLTQKQIDALGKYPGMGWISALRSTSIRDLMKAGTLQRSLFDQKNLAEISSPEFPGERLIACYNPVLAGDRCRTRNELLKATEVKLEKLSKEIKRRTQKPLAAGTIGMKAGKIINHFKMAKHFELAIKDATFTFSRNLESIQSEEQLDGIYVIRTSEPKERLTAEQTVRDYKSLQNVERAFRCLKGMDLMVRPIFLRTEAHVRAHIFLCMLAYYVEWHMRQALAPLLFADEELNNERKTRDPVLPAQPSNSAQEKRAKHITQDGMEVHSFKTLMEAMANRTRNTCVVKAAKANQSENPDSTFIQISPPTPLQARVLELLGL